MAVKQKTLEFWTAMSLCVGAATHRLKVEKDTAAALSSLSKAQELIDQEAARLGIK